LLYVNPNNLTRRNGAFEMELVLKFDSVWPLFQSIIMPALNPHPVRAGTIMGL
jgi:hypothetical protein